MALKDHSLDDKITAAAMKEFSAKGYNGASLRKIAEGAGVTVGAIQTRYRSKDELFASLLKPLLNDVNATFLSVKADYYSGADERLLGLIISAQFDSYRRIVIDCPDRESAEKYMSALITYHLGGWTALFDSEKILSEDTGNEI